MRAGADGHGGAVIAAAAAAVAYLPLGAVGEVIPGGVRGGADRVTVASSPAAPP